jgi:hypothetical protein
MAMIDNDISLKKSLRNAIDNLSLNKEEAHNCYEEIMSEVDVNKLRTRMMLVIDDLHTALSGKKQ